MFLVLIAKKTGFPTGPFRNTGCQVHRLHERRHLGPRGSKEEVERGATWKHHFKRCRHEPIEMEIYASMNTVDVWKTLEVGLTISGK